MFTKKQIGEILKSLRENSKMTQKEAAAKIGRTQQIIGHWETGYSQPDADTLFTLCEIYGSTVDEAFGFYTQLKLSPKEKSIIEKYRQLDMRGLRAVDETLEREYLFSTK